MPVDVETQLRHLGLALLRRTSPTTMTDVESTPSGSVTPFARVSTMEHQRPDARGGFRRFVVLAGAAAVVVGLIVIADRPTIDDPPTQEATEPTVPAPAMAAPGALILDPLPSGWKVNFVSDQRSMAGSDVFLTRIYTTDFERPETAPALTVQLVDSDAGTPAIPDSATTVAIRLDCRPA